MDMYGVSRTVLREALKTLEAKGLVEARPKVGTRVASKGRWALFDQQVLLWYFEAGFEAGFIENLFRIRSLLEGEAVEQATRHRTADHVRMMYYWVQQMSISRGVAESFALANLELHRILMEAAQNPVLRATLGVIEFTLAAAMPTAGTDDGASLYYETLVASQRGLVHAVEKGDTLGALDFLADIIKQERATALATISG
jgi:DNA-binding FadR family transcriptional regulator